MFPYFYNHGGQGRGGCGPWGCGGGGFGPGGSWGWGGGWGFGGPCNKCGHCCYCNRNNLFLQAAWLVCSCCRPYDRGFGEGPGKGGIGFFGGVGHGEGAPKREGPEDARGRGHRY